MQTELSPPSPFPAPSIVTWVCAPGLPFSLRILTNIFDGLVVFLSAVWILELGAPVPEFSVLRRLCHDLR